MDVKPAAGIFLFWVLSVFGFYALGRLLPNDAWQVYEYVTILGGIVCLGLVTQFYRIYIEPGIQGKTIRRIIWLVVSVLIFLSGYWATAFLGVKHNFLMAVHTANLVLFACVLGNWLVSPLKRSAELVPLCMVVALSDMFSVFAGPTKQFASSITGYYRQGADGIPPFVDFILVKLPFPGNDMFIPVFGITDWIIIVLLSAGAAKFEMDDNLLPETMIGTKKRSCLVFFPVAGLGLILSITGARFLGAYLPALPFIVVVFLAIMAMKYPGIRQLTRSEIRPMIIMGAVMAAAMAVFKITAIF
ncbi:MAG: hypothetical protein MI892_21925 [Desulfobacterales bacterium]|nr:hypothetical protein [Desulfobacterales bacterium]